MQASLQRIESLRSAQAMIKTKQAEIKAKQAEATKGDCINLFKCYDSDSSSSIVGNHSGKGSANS